MKSPHFKIIDTDRNHAPECPYGAAQLETYGAQRPSVPTGRVKLEADLPEQLVEVRAGRAEGDAKGQRPQTVASPDEVRRRVRNRLTDLATAHQSTTSLLRVLVTARVEATKALYRTARAKGKPASEHSKFVFDELKKYPLKLYGRQSDYDRAFRKTDREPWTGDFIYYGTANVETTPDGYRLLSLEQVKMAGFPDRTAVVYVICDRTNPVNLMQRRTIQVLDEAIRRGTHVKWAAYGSLRFNVETDQFELTATKAS
ncbi:hypothetical protein [Burkholderia sp. Ax-1719]|uniref:hypothetical protein n=1 Tax=Burkholderia sp. Ax-1719 TaxID=2608334 RepID=UPI00142073CD|nr:hypothetical protein [Burkholderia sp. Ax-1719]NIE63053.1 hypothetical protein [Burkholderia sp. Ax-1719]